MAQNCEDCQVANYGVERIRTKRDEAKSEFEKDKYFDADAHRTLFRTNKALHSVETEIEAARLVCDGKTCAVAEVVVELLVEAKINQQIYR